MAYNDPTKPLSTSPGDIEAAIHAGRINAGITDLGHGRIVRHKDVQIEVLEEVVPTHHRSKACLESLESFLDYVTRYKLPESYGFLSKNSQGYRCLAILQYGLGSAPADTRKAAIVADYSTKISDAFVEWHKKNRQLFSQTDFADFVEFRRKEIIAPEAADLLEMVRTIETTRDVEFKQAIDDRTGRVSITYRDEERHLNGDTAFPAFITILVPLFENSVLNTEINCKMRYRVDDGKLRISYTMENANPLFNEKIIYELDAIRKHTKIPFYLGHIVPSDGFGNPPMEEVFVPIYPKK